ncbi:hypothetical protein TSOC_013071 [Tetrabaena socialis]|uniref:Uncharacterized protein n=1 Tax=Tetrabaena socialis TaxID=47790 RepID=A0A2J7ZLC0_9CHLO|nr:hypothetical protein TSOC_013071 [Tetrabaena socialis]|eukprot:PNH01061.1 hypothetical protein TSOC_013071 [Tetrabaena socialis]
MSWGSTLAQLPGAVATERAAGPGPPVPRGRGPGTGRGAQESPASISELSSARRSGCSLKGARSSSQRVVKLYESVLLRYGTMGTAATASMSSAWRLLTGTCAKAVKEPPHSEWSTVPMKKSVEPAMKAATPTLRDGGRDGGRDGDGWWRLAAPLQQAVRRPEEAADAPALGAARVVYGRPHLRVAEYGGVRLRRALRGIWPSPAAGCTSSNTHLLDRERSVGNTRRAAV